MSDFLSLLSSIKAEDGFTKLVDTVERMSMTELAHLSFNNRMIILSQMDDASHVTGYKKWLKLERQVMKGQKSMIICVPKIKKIEKIVNGKTEKESKLYGYATGRVFDISQTAAIVDGETVEQSQEEMKILKKIEYAANVGDITLLSSKIEHLAKGDLFKSFEISGKKSSVEKVMDLCRSIIYHVSNDELDVDDFTHIVICEVAATMLASSYGVDGFNQSSARMLEGFENLSFEDGNPVDIRMANMNVITEGVNKLITTADFRLQMLQ